MKIFGYGERLIQCVMLIHAHAKHFLYTYKVYCIDGEDTHEIQDAICVLHSLVLQQKQGHSHEVLMLMDESE